MRHDVFFSILLDMTLGGSEERGGKRDRWDEDCPAYESFFVCAVCTYSDMMLRIHRRYWCLYGFARRILSQVCFMVLLDTHPSIYSLLSLRLLEARCLFLCHPLKHPILNIEY